MCDGAALPAVVSEVPGPGEAVNDTIDARAAAAGLPLSAVTTGVAAPPASASPLPAASLAPGATASSGAGATGSPLPGATGSSVVTAGNAAAGNDLTRAVVSAWARGNAATFVRAVQPAFFAPRLPATRLGVTFYERTLTRVAVAGAAGAAARAVARLDSFGWVALRRSAGSLASAALPVVYYRASDRRLALALAGDLGLRASQVVKTAGGPAGVTLVVPG